MKNFKSTKFSFLGLTLILFGIFITNKVNAGFLKGKKDDWVYNPPADLEYYFFERMDPLFLLYVVGAAFALSILMMILGKIFKNRVTNKYLKIIFKIIRSIGLFIFSLYLIALLSLVFLFLFNYLQSESQVNNYFYIGATLLLFLFCFFLFYQGFKKRKSEIKKEKKWANFKIYIGVCIILSLLLLLVAFKYEYRQSSSSYSSSYYSSSYGINSVSSGLSGSLGSASSESLFSLGSSKSLSNYAMDSNIGFAVGGAKDINVFRENIDNNYTPLPSAITYEGLFYDYYFNTGLSEECTKLFCPSYSYALSQDPLSGEKNYYLSVGLNSNIKESDFTRKKLNLVVVLDISGSMGSKFNSYYYDGFTGTVNEEKEIDDEDSNKTKMEIANESLVALMDHLKDDDRFSLVLFDDDAYLAKPLNLIGETDVKKIQSHILEIGYRGGTNMSAGMKKGIEQFSELKNVNKNEYENRVIFLTDAMPNLGESSEEGLLSMIKKMSDEGIYTTFIGVGLDFNTDLIEGITKIKGANYYSVNSPSEFKQKMDDDFEFMVTPLVFNLNLTLEANGYDIEKVYGSPEANLSTGEIMKVNTLFPSRTKEGETKGGLVLLKLKKTADNPSLTIKTTYQDRNGIEDGQSKFVNIENQDSYYANTGIRKGIALSRYADLLKNWINDTRLLKRDDEPIFFDYYIDMETGIKVPLEIELGEWEQKSVPLFVDTHYGKLFSEFKTYYQNEIAVINDKELEKEIKVLDKLINSVKATDVDLNKDSDFDGLSDIDEKKYNTDINNPDTDNDGYSDGDEVKNGFNPNGEGLLNF